MDTPSLATASEDGPLLTADKLRIWAVEQAFRLAADSLEDLIRSAAQSVTFVANGPAKPGHGHPQDIRQWAFQTAASWHAGETPLSQILETAEKLARFAETGEVPDANPDGATSLTFTGLDGSVLTFMEDGTFTISDPAQVATPTVTGGNDASNGVVSSPASSPR